MSRPQREHVRRNDGYRNEEERGDQRHRWDLLQWDSLRDGLPAKAANSEPEWNPNHESKNGDRSALRVENGAYVAAGHAKSTEHCEFWAAAARSTQKDAAQGGDRDQPEEHSQDLWKRRFEKRYTPPGDENKPGGWKARSGWLVRVNDLRNEVNHARMVTSDDHDFLVTLKTWLVKGQAENDL